MFRNHHRLLQLPPLQQQPQRVLQVLQVKVPPPLPLLLKPPLLPLLLPRELPHPPKQLLLPLKHQQPHPQRLQVQRKVVREDLVKVLDAELSSSRYCTMCGLDC